MFILVLNFVAAGKTKRGYFQHIPAQYSSAVLRLEFPEFPLSLKAIAFEVRINLFHSFVSIQRGAISFLAFNVGWDSYEYSKTSAYEMFRLKWSNVLIKTFWNATVMSVGYFQKVKMATLFFLFFLKKKARFTFKTLSLQLDYCGHHLEWRNNYWNWGPPSFKIAQGEKSCSEAWLPQRTLEAQTPTLRKQRKPVWNMDNLHDDNTCGMQSYLSLAQQPLFWGRRA